MLEAEQLAEIERHIPCLISQFLNHSRRPRNGVITSKSITLVASSDLQMEFYPRRCRQRLTRRGARTLKDVDNWKEYIRVAKIEPQG
jgi:hypothetical protein